MQFLMLRRTCRSFPSTTPNARRGRAHGTCILGREVRFRAPSWLETFSAGISGTTICCVYVVVRVQGSALLSIPAKLAVLRARAVAVVAAAAATETFACTIFLLVLFSVWTFQGQMCLCRLLVKNPTCRGFAQWGYKIVRCLGDGKPREKFILWINLWVTLG